MLISLLRLHFIHKTLVEVSYYADCARLGKFIHMPTCVNTYIKVTPGAAGDEDHDHQHQERRGWMLLQFYTHAAATVALISL